MKLMQRAISTITRPGKVTSHQNLSPSLWPSLMRTPSAGLGGWTPKPRNERRRLGQDRGGDDQRRVDDDRPDGVREDVADDDPPVAGTGRLRRLDELLLAQREEGAAHDPGEARPEEEREDDRDALRIALADVHRDRQQHREARQRQHQVGQPHQHVVDPAAEVAADRADRRADHGREQRDDERHPERRPQAVDDPAERVAAEEVGAEEVVALRRRRERDAEEVRLVEGVRREEVGEDRDDAEEEQDDQAAHRQPVAEEAPQRVAPLAARLQLEAGVVGELEVLVGLHRQLRLADDGHARRWLLDVRGL